MKEPEKLMPKHGGYRTLMSFQAAQRVYDATLIFCERFIERRSRTFDQMVQAARSGVQNIAEGSVASGTSKKGELKLTNVARASLEELLLDYEDYIRQAGLRRWDKDSREALIVRAKFKSLPTESEPSNPSNRSDPYGIALLSSETAANTLICLVNQASFLLRLQLKRLERDFLRDGGFTEKLYGARKDRRQVFRQD